MGEIPTPPTTEVVYSTTEIEPINQGGFTKLRLKRYHELKKYKNFFFDNNFWPYLWGFYARYNAKKRII